jgi:hypothetical protein
MFMDMNVMLVEIMLFAICKAKNDHRYIGNIAIENLALLKRHLLFVLTRLD